MKFIIFHFIGLYGFMRLFQYPMFYSIDMILLYKLGGLFGTSVGVHTLWSHRAFKARFPLRVFLMFWASVVNQGTIYTWVKNHHLHHKYQDTNADPYNIKKGFWYAHMKWIYMTKDPEAISKSKHLNIEYLKRDSIVMFQKRNAWWLLPLCMLIVPTVYGYYRLGNAIDAFCIYGVLRWLVNLHCTFLINSAAHSYGSRKYSSNIEARDSFIVNLLTLGAGSHNWHHTYPTDYAGSESDMIKTWKVYNPSKTFIDIMYYLGLAYDLKRFDHQNKKWITF